MDAGIIKLSDARLMGAIAAIRRHQTREGVSGNPITQEVSRSLLDQLNAEFVTRLHGARRPPICCESA